MIITNLTIPIVSKQLLCQYYCQYDYHYCCYYCCHKYYYYYYYYVYDDCYYYFNCYGCSVELSFDDGPKFDDDVTGVPGKFSTPQPRKICVLATPPQDGRKEK